MRKLYTFVFFAFLTTTANCQIVNIPDSYLKTALLNYSPIIDLNNNDQIEVSEALLVTQLILPAYQQPDVIENLTGLEAFTNLVYLDISNTDASNTFNVSPFINLEYLDCSNRPNLTVIGIESLSGTLLHLDCSWTNVPALANIAVMTNLQYLDCSRQASLPSLNVSNMASLTYLDCNYSHINSLNLSGSGLTTLNCNTNNLTSLNLSTLLNLTNLNCSGNPSLVTTPALGNLTSLEHLNCQSNGLTSLNLTALTNLITLNCSQNNLTSLNFTNLQNLTELNCSYNNLGNINVTPLINLTKLYCIDSQLSSLTVNSLTNLTELNCRLNQISTLNISELVNLEVLDFGYNQVSTIDLTPFTQLKDFRCLNNQLTTLDISNCPLLVTFDCASNQLTSLDATNNTRMRFVDCSFNLFTSLDFSTFSGIGGLAQYWFRNNPLLEYVNLKCGHYVVVNVNSGFGCPNLAYICADESNINSIRNSLGFWGENQNVQVNSYCTFNPGGDYNTLTGTIGIDSNGDGCDISDLHFPGIRMNINNGSTNSYTFTDSQGHFTFYLPSGNYTVTPQPEMPYYSATPASAVINFPTNNEPLQTQSFCLSPNGIHNDLEISILPIVVANPGFEAVYKIIYRNKGNQTLSGDISFGFNDNVLDFISASQTTQTQSAGLLTWNYNTLAPFEARAIEVVLHVHSPMEVPPVNIGEQLYFSASLSPILGDETPADNTATFNQTVVGSFDPNDKTCLEGTTITPSMVGSYLHYLIRFQNTGTFNAQNIVVKDIIDTTKFDIATLQLTSSSHSNVTRINGNKVEFIFQNINLPAEIDNEAASHGFVAFKIKTKNNLVLGNSVQNTAEIYFDFNFPIITNTTSTTVALLSVDDIEANHVSITPIPVKDLLQIKSLNSITSVALFDIQGRLLQTKIVNDFEASLDFTGQSKGIYLVKVYTANGTKVQKVIKN